MLRLVRLAIHGCLDWKRLVVVGLIIVDGLRSALKGLSKVNERIDRLAQALDANKLEQAAQPPRKPTVLIEVKGLASRHAPFHGFKLAFERADAANNRDLRFAQKLWPAEVAGVRVN